MTTRIDPKSPRTSAILEEMPVLSENERAALRSALEGAEASIKAGEAVEYDRKTFKHRLMAIYRGAKR